MLRRQSPEEDSTVLIDVAPEAEKGHTYGSTAPTSEVNLERQRPASPPWDPGLTPWEGRGRPTFQEAPAGARPWQVLCTGYYLIVIIILRIEVIKARG